MSGDDPHSALRELRRHLGHGATLAALAGTAGVLAVTGPFGTDAALRLAPRLLYWAVTVGATYAIGVLVADLALPRLRRRLPALAAELGAGLLVGLALVPVVLGLNLAALGHRPAPADLPGFAATIVALGAIVTLAIAAAHRATAPPAPPPPPALLDRLPHDRRGAIVALSVEDHYTRIRTTRGESLLLLRLSDAIRETAPVPGLRVHRSHWVALDHVRAARRTGDRALLEMTHGDDIPASRAHIPRLKEAGLLPR